MRAHRRGRGVDVDHACRHVGELIRRTHLLLRRFHEGRLPQRPGGPVKRDSLRISANILVSCVSIVPCDAPVALVSRADQPYSDITASEIEGHGSMAHCPKSRSVRTTSASSTSGSAQMKPPAWPKWPYVRAELRAPVQCGDFASL